MILSIAEKYWKNIIILSNLIFIVYSIVLISLGIDKLNFLNRFTIILHNAIPIIIPMIISSGLLCLITALIGLIGLIKQKQCIALIHIGGLMISAIIEFSTATMSAVSKDQFFMKVNSSLHESVVHYHQDFDIKNEFNNLQMTLGCCGASYFRDYLKIHSTTPSSCKPTSYGFGCVAAITRYMQQYIILLMYLCFIFAILKGIYVTISILLFRKTVGKENSSV
ncbi:unnamed protein product [Schistosoma mattheei]|uniref:Tetraspanin n=3 Tax=Schistosoma mattheei TaxID=31246 RepID=A0AA85BF70_9TREM|nr:unnamed protein product [Schistosoma mattheei]